MRMMVALLALLLSSSMSYAQSTGYVISSGRTLWNASGSTANQGLGSITTTLFTTATCLPLTQVTQSQIDRTALPGAAPLPIPGSGIFIASTCSGGASGGIVRFDLDVVDFVPGNGLFGQWQFFSSGFNSQAHLVKVLMNNLAATNRLVFANNPTTAYARRTEGWNLHQTYCSPSLLFPEFAVEAGVPTCASTIEKWRVDWTIPANVTSTVYFGDVIANYAAKPQITIWSADGDNTAFTEMYTYMSARNMRGSYAPTIGEINQGANPMSLANLLTMQANGWTMHGHQSTSPIGSYTALSASALTSEIALVKSLALSQNIRLGTVYQPPGSTTNDAVQAELVRQGFSGIVQGGNVSADANGRVIYGGIISPLLWSVPAETYTFTQNKAVIDHAIQYGEAVSMIWHKVDGTVICNAVCFRQTIDYLTRLRDANILDVVTWEGLVNNQYKQGRN